MSETTHPLEDWQNYPTIAGLLTDQDRYNSMRNRCLKSCQDLDQLLRSNDPENQEVAQTSINAFGLALDLLEEAIRARDEAMDQR